MRTFLLVCGAAAAMILIAAPGRAQQPSPLAGVWVLDPARSDIPPEIGFNIVAPDERGSGQTGQPTSGGRGRRGSTGGAARSGGVFSAPLESYDDARRRQLFTAEARKPAARLMIVDTGSAVTFTNELGQSRVFHPNGTAEWVDLAGVPVFVTATRDDDRLVIVYHVEQNRDVRCSYSHSANPSQLIVDVEFLEHGSGDKERLIYEPGLATTTAPAAASATPSAAPAQPAAPDSFDQRPGAELRGIATIGILVEDVSREAAACGVNRAALEDAVAKRLTAAGLQVRRNSDDDTYVYVNVMTTMMPNGTCVSRYDLSLDTQATARVSYHPAPVLVQASLFHRGGIAATASATHAAAVTRGLESYADLLVTQIHDANK